MKPMLGVAADLKKLKFPMLVSPKLDGVRALVIDAVVVSRNLKPIPNRHVQALFGRPELNGFDGELIVGAATSPTVYRDTVSGVMAEKGKPDVQLWVFDKWDAPGVFTQRQQAMLTAVKLVRSLKLPVIPVQQAQVGDHATLEAAEEGYLAAGFEGAMLRSPLSLYKQGRSTVNEAALLKLKRLLDSEAEITGCYELLHNANEARRNALGQLERSSHKANKVGRGCLGGLHVRDAKTGVEFDIGTGFNQELRDELWARRDQLVGQLVKYKYFPTGSKDKPRFPVFLGFRDPIDL
jgi:DNA ligase-1